MEIGRGKKKNETENWGSAQTITRPSVPGNDSTIKRVELESEISLNATWLDDLFSFQLLFFFIPPQQQKSGLKDFVFFVYPWLFGQTQ